MPDSAEAEAEAETQPGSLPQPAAAPGTPAPGTPAPGTPAPGTPAPGTPAPGTVMSGVAMCSVMSETLVGRSNLLKITQLLEAVLFMFKPFT
eukprot:10626610-Alexandrium_andersonii.AAC.1